MGGVLIKGARVFKVDPMIPLADCQIGNLDHNLRTASTCFLAKPETCRRSWRIAVSAAVESRSPYHLYDSLASSLLPSTASKYETCGCY